MRPKRSVIPLPAAAAGAGPFTIQVTSREEGGFSTRPGEELPSGLFGAPLDDAPESLAIRAHEYGHLALKHIDCDPGPRPSSVTALWWQAVLDVFVNSFMLEQGCREIELLMPLQWPANLEDTEIYNLAAVWLRAEGLACCHEVRPALEASGLSPNDCRFLSEAVTTLAEAGRAAAHCSRPKPPRFKKIAKSLQKRFGPFGRADPPVCQIAFAGPAADLPYNQWGDLEILNLASTYRKPLTGRRHRPGLLGPFQYPHRATITSDGRAFRSRLPRGGFDSGTVLIDCSGSMRLDAHLLDRILQRLPAATIAAYAGVPFSNRSGRLIVFAAGHRIAPDASALTHHLGSGNVVDGPALEWLARQRWPRIWISDGIVTGINDLAADNLDAEAGFILERAGIHRYPTPEDYLRGMEPQPGQ